jgi:uracil-DNA glycosylase
MALHESALEELGLAPIWVRRGSGQAVAEGDASAVSAPATIGAAAASSDFVARSGETGAAPGSETVQQHAARTPRSPIEDPAARTAARVGSNARPQDAMPEPRERMDAANVARTANPGNAANAADASPPQTSPDDFAWFDDLPSSPPGEAPLAPAAPAEFSVQTLDWDALSERVAACERCRLCEKRTNTVFGVGDRNADWMLIGEAPGENEDRQGEPFVGQAGKLLDNMLRSLTLARDTNVYIANVIKCRPPGNRNPEPDEVARCEPYLQRQVALVKPKLIIALGRFAAQSLLKTDASISSLRGRVHAYEGVPVIVTYHPAYLLRSLPDKAKAWTDLCLARDTWLAAAKAADASDR